MLNLLIVDDDQHYRYALRAILPWEEHGYHIVGEAVHGRQALAMLEQNQVDLIITDISMPQMNGVELIQAVTRMYPNIAVIALSSYDDFAFVKEAMKYGARDYILKYEMQAEDILRVAEEARGHLRKAQGRPSLDSLTPSGRDYLAGVMLHAFLTGDASAQGRHELRQFFHLHHIHSRSPQLAILIAEHGAAQLPTGEPPAAFALPVLAARLDEHRALWIANLGGIRSDRESHEALDGLAGALRALFAQGGGPPPTMGVSSIFWGYDGMRGGCKQALLALEEQVYGGAGRIYRYDRRVATEDPSPELAECHGALLRAIGRGEGWDKLQAQLWRLIGGEKPAAAGLNGLLADLRAVLAKARHGREPTPEQARQAAREIELARTLEEKKALLSRDFACLQALPGADHSQKVRQVMAYIQAHYSENISVNLLSEQMGLSPNYLGSLFRSETGERITEYLNRVRIEQAKPLILEDRLKNYEIAERVGFESASYFSTIFKRVTGVSIQKYKKRPELTL